MSMTPANLALGNVSFYAYLTTIFSILTLGLVGNLLTVLVLCHASHRQKSLTPFLLNLAVADIIVCLLGYSVAGLHQAIGNESPLQDTARCAWIAFINAFTGLAAIGTLTTMSVLTHMNVTQHILASTDRMSARSVTFVLTGIWVYAFTLAVPPAFGWNRFVTVESEISCHPDWTSQDDSDVAYIVFLAVFGFFVPLLLISYTSAGIIKYLKRTSQAVRQANEGVHDAPTRPVRKSGLIVLATVFGFFVSWSPYAIVSLMSTIKGQAVISPILALLPDMMAKASVVYNPIVYVLINGAFRRTLIGVLRGSLNKFGMVTFTNSTSVQDQSIPQRPNVRVETHND